MATTLRHQIEENYSENADLIDEDHSGDLDVGEVETLLAAMGITGVQSQWVLQASLRGVSKTSHQRVTDAILLHADIDETKLQIMLGRVALFGKVFRWLDIDGDGQLSLPEIMRMMELLNIDLKLAADLMAFLDLDDSGDVNWQEFVRGVCSDQFAVLFPQITLEALVELPSSLRRNKLVSKEEERQAIRELPAVEKTLYWVLSLMYGTSSGGSDKQEDDLAVESCEIPVLHPSKDAIKAKEERLALEENFKPGPMGPMPLRTLAASAAASAHSGPAPFAVADIPSLVQTMNQCRAQVITRKEPKGSHEIQQAVVRWSTKRAVVVRKEAKNPHLARPAVVQPKPPAFACAWASPPREAPELKLEHFPELAIPEGQEGNGQDGSQDSPAKLSPAGTRRISLGSNGLQAAAQAVSDAISGVASSLASAFGSMSKESNNKVTKRMSVKEAASVMKSMDVKVTKAHVLTEAKRKGLWRCMYAAIFTGALAGVGAAFLAQMLNEFTTTIVDEEEDYLLWNTLAGSFSLLWSLAEMLVCCIAALMATVKMTRICGIMLVPMDKERAMLAGSLARSALELGHPKVRTFGIDPYKRANRCLLIFYALIYMGSRGVTKFLIKLIIKKAAPRTFLKVAEVAPLAIEVVINVLFNIVTVRYAMNEVMICSLGPSATVEATSQLIKAHRKSLTVEEPLSDELKLLTLRAVGVSITYKMQLHPNSRFLLNHAVGLFADQSFVKRAKAEYGATLEKRSLKRSKSMKSNARGGCCGCRSEPTAPTEALHEELADLGLDEEELFFSGLRGLSHRDALFACSMLVLALMLDGRIARTDWAFIQRAAQSAEPPLEAKWASAVYLLNMYCKGKQMSAEMFHQIFETSDGKETSASCSDYVSDTMRTVLEYTNCC